MNRLQGIKMVKGQAYIDRVSWAMDLLNKTAPDKKERVGVEVGLWKADFAMLMLEADKNLHWYGVDPYFMYGHKHRKQSDWDAVYARVCSKMEKYGERFTLVRKPSIEGVEFIPDNVDFVFIDGNHDYKFVLDDITAYEKKVRPGGILAGHDYFPPYTAVRKAANEYAEKHNRDLNASDKFDPYGVFWWKVPNQ